MAHGSAGTCALSHGVSTEYFGCLFLYISQLDSGVCIQGTVIYPLVYPRCSAQLQTQRKDSGRTCNVQLWRGVIPISKGKEAAWPGSQRSFRGADFPF